ncbi:Cold shock protein 1 [Linum grandiflorum]
MAEDQAVRSSSTARTTGKVVKFSDKKGFGFIKPEDGSDDLFVHHTAIKSDGGYRTLTEEDVVEFEVAETDGKCQAINVTAPGGGPIQAGKRGGGDGYGRRGAGSGAPWNRRSNGGGFGAGAGGAGCYTCGNTNHIARDCNHRSETVGSCFKCGTAGHFARDCPQAVNGRGGGGGGASGGACFSCSGFGHLARDCPGGSGACYNCGGYGHLARDCTSARTVGGGGGGRFGSSGACFNCGKAGHLARECTNPEF